MEGSAQRILSCLQFSDTGFPRNPCADSGTRRIKLGIQADYGERVKWFLDGEHSDAYGR